MICPPSFKTLISQDGLVVYDQSFFTAEDSTQLLNRLVNGVLWRQDPITIFGKTMMQPRLTCWMGDPGAIYQYSSLTLDPEPWMPEVAEIKTRLESALSVSFNSVLLNYYRDGNDSMGWHRDNEKELGQEPVIASVTFGAERRFLLRRYKTKDRQMSVQLGHGSVLVMAGTLQEFWEHSVPKTGKLSARQIGPRINLTFRHVYKKT
jgi:alkylated DNA repair dioxygenase AlkB